MTAAKPKPRPHVTSEGEVRSGAHLRAPKLMRRAHRNQRRDLSPTQPGNDDFSGVGPVSYDQFALGFSM
jgi:hypothetical protein